MKAKILTYAVAVGCMLGAVAFGQTVQITGTVLPATNANMIVLQSGPQMKLPCGAGTWFIAVTPTTTVTPSPSPGITVVVTCRSPDAQRKEEPGSSPCPSPSSTPKP